MIPNVHDPAFPRGFRDRSYAQHPAGDAKGKADVVSLELAAPSTDGTLSSEMLMTLSDPNKPFSSPYLILFLLRSTCSCLEYITKTKIMTWQSGLIALFWLVSWGRAKSTDTWILKGFIWMSSHRAGILVFIVLSSLHLRGFWGGYEELMANQLHLGNRDQGVWCSCEVGVVRNIRHQAWC